MSVENLRVDEPASKGWANLFMNNLTVYNKITANTVKAEKFETTGVTENTIVEYKYRGSVVHKTFNLLFTKTADLVTIQLLSADVGTIIPANNNNEVVFTPTNPLPLQLGINHLTCWPIWLFVNNQREIGTFTISKAGIIDITRGPAPPLSYQGFVAGEEVTLERSVSFTYVRE